jgi:hypothetical protein
MNTLLTFGRGNGKLEETIGTFSLPTGFTCPGAKDCLARANKLTGKITDGPHQKYRCFSATAEAAFPSVRESRHRNWDLLKAAKTRQAMAALISASLPKELVIRVHVAGLPQNADYFMAWSMSAHSSGNSTPHKGVNLWRNIRRDSANFVLTASEGGKFDAMIGDLKRATVVFTPEQATALGVEIDHDDSHAHTGTQSFALLLHGQQAKGSAALDALKLLKAAGIGGYGRGLSQASSLN